MDDLMIGFLVFLGSIFISRKVSNDAMLKLESDKKVELIDMFSKKNTSSYIILFGIIVLFFANIKFNFIDQKIAYLIYCIIIMIYIIFSSYKSYEKLKNNNFPIQYIKSYIISIVIKTVGILVFFLLLWN